MDLSAPGGARRLRPVAERDARATSLQAYFALLVAVFVVAAGAAILYVHLQAGSDAKAAARRSADFAADTAARQLGNDIATLKSSVAGLASNPQIAQAVRHPAGCSLAYAGGGSDRGHLDILRRDGTPVCSSRPRPRTGGFRRYSGAWLERARVRPVFAAPVLDRPTGHRVAISAAPIPGQGFVVGFYDLTSAGPHLASLYGGGQPVLFLVVSSDGRRVVARSDRPERWVGARLPAGTIGRSSEGEARDLDGTVRLFESTTVPGVGWRLFAAQDKSAVLAARGRLERRQLLVILIGTFAFLAAALLVYRRVGRPLVLLGAEVRSSGEQAVPRPVARPTRGAAEVRRLADDVNGLIASVNRELHEREKAGEALQRSEESYRLLFDRHPATMWVFDPETLRFVAVNQAVLDRYGYTREELVSKSIDQIVPVEDRPGVSVRVREVEQSRVEARMSRHLKKDGSVIDVLVTSDDIVFEGRRARLVLAEDVTERRQLEEQLRQSQKMEAVGSLAGGIAHDFNNISMVIRTSCALLLGRLQDPGSREELLHIDEAAGRAADLTQQLLAVSRQQVLRPEVTDPNSVIERMLDLLHRIIGEDIEIVRDLAPELQSIVVDPGQLGQVILNLAVNAREAMSTGGTLTIRTSNVTVDERYAAGHVDVEPGAYVLLEIGDTGIGMDEATRTRAFDPFFTTKDTGTGLGLATVYGVVNQSGGRVWLYSEPGIGTTFKLFFPSTSEIPAPAKPPTPIGSLDGAETILLVEDEDVLRRLISTALRAYGYTVLEAENGAAALQLAGQHGGAIELLLTDVVMPGINGSELAEQLLADRPDMAVLFTSGYPSDMTVRRGVTAGNADYLEKPYALSDLARLIRQLLERRQEQTGQ